MYYYDGTRYGQSENLIIHNVVTNTDRVLSMVSSTRLLLDNRVPGISLQYITYGYSHAQTQ